MSAEENPVEETVMMSRSLYRAIRNRNWAEARRRLDEVRNNLRGSPLASSSDESIFFAGALIQAGPHIPVDLLRDYIGIADRRNLMEDVGPGCDFLLLHLCVALGYDVERLEIVAGAYPEAVMKGSGKYYPEYQTPIDMFFINSTGTLLEDDAYAKIAMLLRLCPDAAYETDSEGLTILHRAMVLYRGGDIGAFQAIVEARPELILQKNDRGEAPIHVAAEQRQLEACQYLLDAMDPQQVLDLHSITGTALHSAILGDCNERIVRLLVEKVPGLLTTADHHGFFPIDLLRNRNESLPNLAKAVVKRLVDDNPQLLQIVDDEDRDPLALLRVQQELFPNTQDTTFIIAVLSLMGKVGKILIEGTGPSRTLHDLLGNPFFPMDLGGAIVCAAGAEQLRVQDENGDLPIHILASRVASHDKPEHYNLAVKVMLHLFPESARTPNSQGKLPLELMAASQHYLDHGMMLLMEAHPAAVQKIINCPHMLAFLCARLRKDSQYRMWTNAPELAKMLH